MTPPDTRLVVFDMDGTLVDSQAMIIAAMTRAFADHALPPPDPAAVRRVVGLSLIPAIAVLLPDRPQAMHRGLADAYKAAFAGFRVSGDYQAPLYPGAADSVRRLAETGYRLGIATGKSRRGARSTLDQHGLSTFFDIVKTADDAPSKPHPAMLQQAADALGIAPAATVLVGDTSYDMEMARAAGAWPIGVAWGYHEAAQLEAAGAAEVVTTFDELDQAIAHRRRSSPPRR